MSIQRRWRSIQAWAIAIGALSPKLERTTPPSIRFTPATAELTLGNPLQMFFVLSINGLRVDVEVSNGVGDAPDVITVHPPAGFVAVPESIEVDEGSTGRIAIHHALLS